MCYFGKCASVSVPWRTAYSTLLNCPLCATEPLVLFDGTPPPLTNPSSPLQHYMSGEQGVTFFYFSTGIMSAAQSCLAGQAVSELGMDAAPLAV